MSANLMSTDPAHQVNQTGDLTDADFAKIARHSLSYAGELSVWEGSNETVGTLTHGPLLTSTRPKWLTTIQIRNYVFWEKNFEDRDVLHLWLRNETADSVANLWWVRPEGWC